MTYNDAKSTLIMLGFSQHPGLSSSFCFGNRIINRWVHIEGKNKNINFFICINYDLIPCTFTELLTEISTWQK